MVHFISEAILQHTEKEQPSSFDFKSCKSEVRYRGWAWLMRLGTFPEMCNLVFGPAFYDFINNCRIDFLNSTKVLFESLEVLPRQGIQPEISIGSR
jgi:hypothetical protein